MDGKIKMQSLPFGDRPYEKLAKIGAAALSDSELLAILLCNGSRGQTALDLARKLMGENASLAFLREVSIEELCVLPGLGRVKAIRLKAAVELGKRCVSKYPQDERILIQGPEDVIMLMEHDLMDLPREELHVLLLDIRGRLIRRSCMGIGGLHAAVVCPRDVFREAVRANAASVVLCHNHPSGDPTPSEADIQSSKRFEEAGKLMGVKILDHIVIARGGAVSLRREGHF